MPLAIAIAALRDDRLQKLTELHDDYDHTRKLWRMLQVRVQRYGEDVTFHNANTGTRVSGQQLAGRAGASLRRLNEQTFRDIIGQFEVFTGDLLRLWLAEHPELVEDKALDVRTLFSSNSLEDVRQAALRDAVESTVLKKAYSRPNEWFRYLHHILGRNVVAPPEILSFGEMKASRDVLEHARGLANEVYVEKAGLAARFRPGDAVTVDDAYHTTAFQLVRRLIGDVANAAIAAA